MSSTKSLSYTFIFNKNVIILKNLEKNFPNAENYNIGVSYTCACDIGFRTSVVNSSLCISMNLLGSYIQPGIFFFFYYFKLIKIYLFFFRVINSNSISLFCITCHCCYYFIYCKLFFYFITAYICNVFFSYK